MSTGYRARLLAKLRETPRDVLETALVDVAEALYFGSNSADEEGDGSDAPEFSWDEERLSSVERKHPGDACDDVQEALERAELPTPEGEEPESRETFEAFWSVERPTRRIR